MKPVRAYTIDADPPDVCYPIRFTDETPLSAAYGTVIILHDIVYMRTRDGWVDEIGDWSSHEAMREMLMRNPHTSRVVYNTHRTSY